MKQEWDISATTIFKIILIGLVFVFLFLVRDILAMLFAALIIASAVSRPVNYLQKRKVPRILGTLFVYVAVFVVFSALLYIVVPPLAQEIKILTTNTPELVDKIQNSISFVQGLVPRGDLQNNFQFLNQISDQLNSITSGIFASTISIFGGFFSFLVILVLSVYLTLQQAGLKNFILSFVPATNQIYASGLIDRIESRIGAWVVGQIILAATIGIMAFISLIILGVKYALVLAIIAGILEVVPYVGPILSALIAGFLVFLQSPILGLWTLLIFWIIQQAENYLIVPQVMKKAVGLNPIVVIVAILIGGKLAGFIGILLAVPMAAALVEAMRDLQRA